MTSLSCSVEQLFPRQYFPLVFARHRGFGLTARFILFLVPLHCAPGFACIPASFAHHAIPSATALACDGRDFRTFGIHSLRAHLLLNSPIGRVAALNVFVLIHVAVPTILLLRRHTTDTQLPLLRQHTNQIKINVLAKCTLSPRAVACCISLTLWAHFFAELFLFALSLSTPIRVPKGTNRLPLAPGPPNARALQSLDVATLELCRSHPWDPRDYAYTPAICGLRRTRKVSPAPQGDIFPLDSAPWFLAREHDDFQQTLGCSAREGCLSHDIGLPLSFLSLERFDDTVYGVTLRFLLKILHSLFLRRALPAVLRLYRFDYAS
ncbi:hypothetical protein C8F04DRAFT_1200326 [Mycena alexandri]|uniref:Uncharacterized protein n=1 Tax=Mycena alexandri TaxID=1745969 RepID=A0AAD6RYK9_9AGAR|nr:hypothetical protein C8F04DRAFT_1200326 [Mycena alexandri]